jgi:hypothetical protein
MGGIFLPIIFRFREEGTQGLSFAMIFEELKSLDEMDSEKDLVR